MKKKQINIQAITDELAGASLFFSKTKKTPPPATRPEKTLPKSLVATAVPKAINKSAGQPVKKDVNRDVMTSSIDKATLREWRDTIENTETHNSSLRLTNEENYAIEDLINELRRKLKVKTSLNEVGRLGLLYIIHDFKLNREKSLVYKVKKS
jgi:hypothetical protein